jgi:hypothetical protein
MTQALYAHMNNKIIRIKKKKREKEENELELGSGGSQL